MKYRVRLILWCLFAMSLFSCDGDEYTNTLATGSTLKSSMHYRAGSSSPYGFDCYPYRVLDLYELESGEKKVSAINNKGDVASVLKYGDFSTLTYMSHILYRDERRYRLFDCEFTRQDTLDLYFNDLNDNRVAVGWQNYRNREHYPRASYWIPEGKVDFLFADDRESEASAINNEGTVVGWQVTGPFIKDTENEFYIKYFYQAFIWKPGFAEPQVIEGLPEAGEHGNSRAKDVAPNDSFVGSVETVDGKEKPCTWSQTEGFKVLPTLGGNKGIVRSVNNSYQMVGDSTDASGIVKPTLWEDEQVVDLGLLDGCDSGSAMSIGDSGIAVGTDNIRDVLNATTAWVYENGVKKELSQLISPKLELKITNAYAVNGKGEIAAIAVYKSTTRGVLLIPQSCEEYQ